MGRSLAPPRAFARRARCLEEKSRTPLESMSPAMRRRTPGRVSCARASLRNVTLRPLCLPEFCGPPPYRIVDVVEEIEPEGHGAVESSAVLSLEHGRAECSSRQDSGWLLRIPFLHRSFERPPGKAQGPTPFAVLARLRLIQAGSVPQSGMSGLRHRCHFVPDTWVTLFAFSGRRVRCRGKRVR